LAALAFQYFGAEKICAGRKFFPNLNLFEILQFSTEERFARTIAAFCESALANAASKLGKLINYTQLPEAVTNFICNRFGVFFSAEEVEKMQSSTKFHAKTPQMEFNPDSEKKRKEANPEVIKFAENLVQPLYERLENRREPEREL
jgi:hypothetical protein